MQKLQLVCIRHTFCTRLCEKEMNVKTIQVIMGHKDIQTTLDIYADVTEATKQTAITKLANDLDGLLQFYYNLGLLKGIMCRNVQNTKWLKY